MFVGKIFDNIYEAGKIGEKNQNKISRFYFFEGFWFYLGIIFIKLNQRYLILKASEIVPNKILFRAMMKHTMNLHSTQFSTCSKRSEGIFFIHEITWHVTYVLWEKC